MTFRFVARIAVTDENPAGGYRSAGVAENADGSGFALIFQSSLHQPDPQDVALGMDTYCLVTADQETAYGTVVEAVLADGVLRVVVSPDAQEPLGLDDTVIEATLDVDHDAVEQLRDGLRRILNYGRLDARPAVLQI
jgi:hypothetical protein